ncbi:hypothetical protein DSO57_1020874 [Entomophthora muscae]|uniref:Uncharacterized protein n=1 Tax=Entomophthora muscae TaxID=34485 RepID=A0ACC2S5N8_9FUNG|nr:hypothetical protein DSO57_1020874 [Entomophthora muscae]
MILPLRLQPLSHRLHPKSHNHRRLPHNNQYLHDHHPQVPLLPVHRNQRRLKAHHNHHLKTHHSRHLKAHHNHHHLKAHHNHHPLKAHHNHLKTHHNHHHLKAHHNRHLKAQHNHYRLKAHHNHHLKAHHSRHLKAHHNHHHPKAHHNHLKTHHNLKGTRDQHLAGFSLGKKNQMICHLSIGQMTFLLPASHTSQRDLCIIVLFKGILLVLVLNSAPLNPWELTNRPVVVNQSIYSPAQCQVQISLDLPLLP